MEPAGLAAGRLARLRASYRLSEEVGVIEEIEEAGAGPDGEPLVESELPTDGDIEICCAKAAQGVAVEVTLECFRRHPECRLAELLSVGTFGPEIRMPTQRTRFGQAQSRGHSVQGFFVATGNHSQGCGRWRRTIELAKHVLQVPFPPAELNAGLTGGTAPLPQFPNHFCVDD